ncbi:MAG: hypothetical protein ABI673_09265 [Novosphingobium sp.]
MIEVAAKSPLGRYSPPHLPSARAPGQEAEVTDTDDLAAMSAYAPA